MDGSKALKLRQMANGTPADAALRCLRMRKMRQRLVDHKKQNCIAKTASEKEPLTPSRRTDDLETHCNMGDCIFEVGNSVNDVTSQREENGKASGRTIQMDNRTTVNSKQSYGD